MSNNGAYKARQSRNTSYYVSLDETSSGWDYKVYDANYEELFSGSIEDDSMDIYGALDEVMFLHSDILEDAFVDELDYEEFQEKVQW